jgi:hypothetical protein
LSDLEFGHPSAPDSRHVEDVCRSLFLMVPTAIDPNHSLRFHVLAIFRRDLPSEGDDSRNDQYLSGVNCRRGERD